MLGVIITASASSYKAAQTGTALTLTDIVQIATAISTAALAVFAGIGLKQIAITKKKNEEETRRSQIAESARQADVFRQLLDRYLRFVRNAKSTLYEGPTELNDTSGEDEPPNWEIWDTEFLEERRLIKAAPYYEDARRFLNYVESFALAVFHMADHELLDEDALFQATGDTFVSIINELYDVLCATRARDYFMLYSHISRLYARWEGRLVSAHKQHLAKIDDGGWTKTLGQLQVLRLNSKGQMGSAHGLIARSGALREQQVATLYVRALDPHGKPLPAWPIKFRFNGGSGTAVGAKGYRDDALQLLLISDGDIEMWTNSSGTVTLYFSTNEVSQLADAVDCITITTVDKVYEPTKQVTYTLHYRHVSPRTRQRPQVIL